MDFNFWDPFTWIGEWLLNLLVGWGLAETIALTLLRFAGAVVLALVLLLIGGVLFTWLDRKLSARIQDRLGPNRVGPFGLFQGIADTLKLLTKEDIIPAGADKIVFNLAPLLVTMSVVGIWAVVPFAPTLIGTDLNVGLLYIISVGSIGTLGIMMAGWASNNKFALLGAFRTVAQMVAYEVPMVVVLLVPTMFTGSMSVHAIVEGQSSLWYVALAPVAALIFLTTSIAELGRAPFDLLEAESELVAGFNTEYTGIKWGMFFASEFLHGLTISALTAAIFLGGWQGPGAEARPLLGFVYFMIKTMVVYFGVTLLRFSMPRVRIDQLLDLNWKFLTPLALAAVCVTAVAEKLALATNWSRLGVHIIANVGLLILTLGALWVRARMVRRRFETEQMRLAARSESAAD
ncbi:MAG TPA: NADH-quinone oxidoreductase subunit NuoH [Anaerolineae bacterium]|nr:NADH-quinone oxidoreductase subunit NuoH [Anaerolineae bacterium]